MKSSASPPRETWVGRLSCTTLRVVIPKTQIVSQLNAQPGWRKLPACDKSLMASRKLTPLFSSDNAGENGEKSGAPSGQTLNRNNGGLRLQ